MADVGVLNLQIQADASQASTSLSALADALTRVKNAVGNGLSFGKLPTQLGKIREALGGNWGGSEQFKTAMTNLKDGANVIARANVGEKLANDAKGITAWVNAYQKVINTLNSVKKQDTASSKVESTVSSATSGMTQNASTFSSAMFGGRFAQHFYALNDPDSGYGKVVSDIKTQTEAVSNAVTTSGAKIKDAVSNSTEAMKSGVPADAASGFKEIENTLKQMDAGTVQNIVSLASALKELKGASGIGKQLNDAAVGLNAVLKFDGSNKGTSGTIERIGTALKHFGEKTIDFKVPSFNNLIKLAEALQKGFFASVEIENIAKALEHLKQASDGFVMPDLTGLTNLASALSGTGTGNADTNVAAGIQQVGTAVDEVTGKMEQLAPVTQEVMNSVAEDAQNTASNIAQDMSEILPDNMTWRVGENMEPAIGQMKTAIDGVRESVADMSQGAETDMQRVSDAVGNATGRFRRLEKIGEGKNAKLKWVEVDPEAERAKVEQVFDTIEETGKRRIALLREMFSNSPLSVQQWVAKSEGMSYDQIFGNSSDMGQMTQTVKSEVQEVQSAEQTAQDQTDQLRDSLQQPVNSFGIEKYKTRLDLLKERLVILREELEKGLTQTGKKAWSDKKINTYELAIDSVKDKIENLQNKYDMLNGENGMQVMSEDAIRAADQFMNTNDQLSIMQMKLDSLKQKLGTGIITGKMDENQIASTTQQIQRLQSKIDQLKQSSDGATNASNTLSNAQNQVAQSTQNVKNAQDQTEESTHRLKNAFNNLKSGMNKLPFVKLIKQMMRMAKMRALRYMIRELAKGFREGVENVYHYSEAIGGSFHESMDSAATALNQMKNSIGAAVAPALQALIPLFNTIVGWITTAANYLNQFFSLLSGKGTWTRALPAASKAFEDQKKSAKGASEAVKDMLADFDELNIIQQNGNGNGTTTTKPETDYTEMFEEFSEFDSKIKDMVEWIEDHMETVKGIAIAIGTAILGWKISKAFDGVLGTLGSIIAGGAMMAIGWQLVYEGAYAAGYNGGFTTESLLTTIGGGITSAIGGGIIGFKLGGTTGAVIGAITGLVVSAAVGIKAYFDGKEAKADADLWGDLKYSAEEMKESIEGLFTFDVTPHVNLLNQSTLELAATKIQVFASTVKLESSLKALEKQIEINPTVNIAPLVGDVVADARTLIDDVNTQINSGRKHVALLLKYVNLSNAQLTNPDGTPFTSDSLMEQLKLDDTVITGYYEDLGKRMAEAYDRGMSTGWANGEAEQVKELAQRLYNIEHKAQQGKIELEAEIAREKLMLNTDWSQMTEDNAIQYAEIQAQALKDYEAQFREPLKEALKEAADSELLNASRQREIKNDLETLTLEELGIESEEERQSLITAADEAYKRSYEMYKFWQDEKNLNDAVDEMLGIGDIKKTLRDKWGETFAKVYNIPEEALAMLSNVYGAGENPYSGKERENFELLKGIVEGKKIGMPQFVTDLFPGTKNAQNLISVLRGAGLMPYFDMLGYDFQKKFFEATWEHKYRSWTPEAQESFDNGINQDSIDAERKWFNERMLSFFRTPEEFAKFMEQYSLENPGVVEQSGQYMTGAEIMEEYAPKVAEEAGQSIAKEITNIARKYTIGTANEDDIKELIEKLKERYGVTYGDEWVSSHIEQALIDAGLQDLVNILRENQPNVSGGLPPLANRLGPEGYRASNAGGPFGPAQERRMNAMQLVWNIEEGLKAAFGGENLTPGESNMFVQPSGYTEDTDDRTANATEAMQQDIVTQNDKIDRVERLLTAVLSRLNAGLNVNMAQTSTAGRMVNGMLDAFTRVTGNN